VRLLRVAAVGNNPLSRSYQVLEQKIDALTAATKENTEAVKALMSKIGDTGVSGGGKATANKPKDTPAAVTKADLDAVVFPFRDKVSAPVCKAFITEVTGAASYKDVKEADYAKLKTAIENYKEPEKPASDDI
jgi:hypothetical protein